VGKCYHLYANPKDRLKQTLWRGRRQFYREFWALRDVSFDLRKGESVGIIGRNGSGKSTLLQILAGILQPTEGQVTVRGRVTALLELGSGFNPEFTGRENVRMQAAIMGFTPEQVDARMDEILAFADIGDFIDQPVKTYSSGMSVRVAFAVQILLDPDILIVDEALAVGDTAFQFKCISRMRKLLDRGVMVVLVTHDPNTVRTFCQKALWLHEGRVQLAGGPLEVTSQYLQFLFGPPKPAAPAPANREPPETRPACGVLRPLEPLNGRRDLIRWGNGDIRVEGVALDNGSVGAAPVFEHGCPLHLEFSIRAERDVPLDTLGVGFAFRNTKGLDIVTYTTYDVGERLPPLRAGQSLHFTFDLDNFLAPGDYALVLNVESVEGDTRHYFDFIENAVLFKTLSSFRIFSAVLPPVRHQVIREEEPAAGGTHVGT
jgi:ABC-type polysaccharide/polyol phosphate transport system ATPase subunit